MTRRAYLILIVGTLAVFSIALLRPEFVLGTLDRFALPATVETAKTIQTDQKPAEQPEQKKDFDLKNINFNITEAEQKQAAAEDAQPKSPEVQPASISASQNHLIIPRMGVDADVIHDDTDAALLKGLWHIPGSAFPGQNGNIVISAHRWLHKPPNPTTFYSIDKIQVGDPIYYDYEGSRYEYKVTKHFIVNPEDVYILDQDENKLTLFTCTPLYSTKQRYVVNAELVSVTQLGENQK
ncbi:MAG: class E sortase [Candidatus Komeilibacteria bacterium]|nr:class E sortase [Candidatus Komeilibacteria bacterium]